MKFLTFHDVLAPISIMGDQLRDPLKPFVHYCSIVPGGLREALDGSPIMPIYVAYIFYDENFRRFLYTNDCFG